MEKQAFKMPTEFIDLPSKGIIYSKDNPLHEGVIEMKYMGSREEDILTNQNYIKQGIVLDKLLESLIVTKIDMKDLLIGDKNALLIAARILGYGNEYSFTIFKNGNTFIKTVDLGKLKEKNLDKSILDDDKNEFKFELPFSKNNITFKLLTHGDEQNINKELEGLKKLFPDAPTPDITVRMKYIITSINGDYNEGSIREFVDKGLLAKDSKELRAYIKKISPDVELEYFEEGEEEGIRIPVGLNFFWPESGL